MTFDVRLKMGKLKQFVPFIAGFRNYKAPLAADSDIGHGPVKIRKFKVTQMIQFATNRLRYSLKTNVHESHIYVSGKLYFSIDRV